MRTLHAAIRGGIRHFDTAQGYGKGMSEQLLGQQLRRFRNELHRSDYTIATKMFLPSDPAEVAPTVSVSLRRLCTDRIDILYIHWPDSKRDCRPYLEQMETLRRRGIVGSIGVSNFTPALLQSASEVTEIGYCQFPLSLLWMKSLERLSPLCAVRKIKTVAYSPLALGLLSGRYRSAADLAEGDRRRSLFPFSEPCHHAFLDLLEALGVLASQSKTDMATLAFLWVLAQGADIVLTGARTKEQLERVLLSVESRVDSPVFDELTEIARSFGRCIEEHEDNPFFHRW